MLAAISHTGINITNTVVTVREYLLNLHSHHIIVAKIDLRLYSAALDGGFRQSKFVLFSLMPSKICVNSFYSYSYGVFINTIIQNHQQSDDRNNLA